MFDFPYENFPIIVCCKFSSINKDLTSEAFLVTFGSPCSMTTNFGGTTEAGKVMGASVIRLEKFGIYGHMVVRCYSLGLFIIGKGGKFYEGMVPPVLVVTIVVNES